MACGDNSVSITLTPPSGWTLIDSAVTALSGANPITTTALYYKKNAASESGSKTFTFSSAVWASMFLMEVSGCDVTAPLDQTASSTQSGTTALVSGTTAATTVANEIAVAIISENSNFTMSAPTNGFTLQDTQKSAASGTARISSALLYKIVSATGAQSTGVTSTATNPVASKIATFKIAPSGSTVNFTSSGLTAGPQQFPLGPPDMTGATTLNDPDTSAVWAPALTDNVDYILNCPNQRSRQLKIVGGRNVYVPKLSIVFALVSDSEMVYVAGGNTGRIIHIDTCYLNPNGFQCDAFKTHSPFSNRHLQIRLCKVEKLLGQTSQVHADLLQSSGGIGDLWVEDFTGYSTYDGFMLQREASVATQTVKYAVSAASVSGANYVYTAVGHTFVAGDPVGVWGCTPDAYNGGFTVLSVAGNNFTVKRGDNSPGALTVNGSVTKMTFPYDCGSINFNRVNVKGFHNDLQNTASLQCIRFGARHAPVPSPNPLNFLHQNEDQTPLNIDWWNGTLNATQWYGNPDAGDVGGYVEPDEGTANYSGSRPVQHAGPPAYADWPLHPNVPATTKIWQGTPPGGDYVLYQSGKLVATVVSTGAGGGVTVKSNTPDAAMSAVTASAYPNAYDLFTRSVGAGGLGTANLGGTYTLSGTAGDFSVNGTQAVIAVTAAAQNKRATLGVSMTNQYATGTFQTDTFPAGSYTAFDVFLRFVDANNYYRCRAILNPNGSVQLQWDRNLASSLMNIKAAVTSSLTLSTGNDYGIYAAAVGTSPTILTAWIWDATAGPPPLPVPTLVAASDSSSALQVASAAGIGCGLNTGSTATATLVKVAQWDVWPTRWQSVDAASVTVGAAPLTVSGGTQKVVTPSGKIWTPRSG